MRDLDEIFFHETGHVPHRDIQYNGAYNLDAEHEYRDFVRCMAENGRKILCSPIGETLWTTHNHRLVGELNWEKFIYKLG